MARRALHEKTANTEIKIVMRATDGIQADEVQRRLDEAFDILFRAVMERRKSKKSDSLSG